jgi:hypothetical protein
LFVFCLFLFWACLFVLFVLVFCFWLIYSFDISFSDPHLFWSKCASGASNHCSHH